LGLIQAASELDEIMLSCSVIKAKTTKKTKAKNSKSNSESIVDDEAMEEDEEEVENEENEEEDEDDENILDKMQVDEVENDENGENPIQSPEESMKIMNDFYLNAIHKSQEEGYSINLRPSKSTLVTDAMRKLERSILKSIHPETCGRCKAKNPKWRKEGSAKVFMKALTSKAKAAAESRNMEMENIDEIMIQNTLGNNNNNSDGNSIQKKKEQYPDDPTSRLTKERQATSSIALNVQCQDKQKGKMTATVLSTKPTKNEDRYLTPMEVKAHMQLLFTRESELLNLLYGHVDPSQKNKRIATHQIYFIDVVPVTPVKFRPASKMGDIIYEHPQNTSLSAVLKANAAVIAGRAEQLAALENTDPQSPAYAATVKTYMGKILNQWLSLQNEVNGYLDSTKKMKGEGNGIRQLLEKKEGLFRKHMMGKRVNFAARSVISPDVGVEGGEIGIPPVFATKLTYPEPVTPHNVEKLRQAVINGPSKWPGATHVQMEDGTSLNLATLDEIGRTAVASTLLTLGNDPSKPGFNGNPKIVMRHLLNGDFLLLNRQPTLHKPSIMAHTARILPHEKTIRMHYSNCNTYNADFDGDEMNVHFPQNEIGRAEAMCIARTSKQYLVPTDGGVLRGLIQDHVDGGVHMTSRGELFEKEDYMNLVYVGLRPDGGVGERLGDGRIEDPVPVGKNGRILILEPAIQKPKKLWTGKQIVSDILSYYYYYYYLLSRFM